MLNKLVVVASAAALFSPAFASDFKTACVAGSPENIPEAASQAYCSCLVEVTNGDEETQEELIASWPADDIDAWLARLSADAAEAAGRCAP